MIVQRAVVVATEEVVQVDVQKAIARDEKPAPQVGILIPADKDVWFAAEQLPQPVFIQLSTFFACCHSSPSGSAEYLSPDPLSERVRVPGQEICQMERDGRDDCARKNGI